MVAPAEVLAIVPARGGSKGIPGKNIKLLDGYPLISYSIAAGLRAQFVSRVIVSTDDEEIADIASSWGAEVPFLRPPELAQDDSPDLPVFQHALRWLSEHENYRPEIIVQLRPTSPLRPVDCVDRAVEALMENPLVDSVRAVVPSGQNPYKMWLLDETRAMKPLLAGASPEPYNNSRQMLPPTYWQTGHVDVARYATIMDKNSMSGETIRPLVLESAYTLDIDTDNDWERAEWILSRSHLTIVRPAAMKVGTNDQQQSSESMLPSDVRLLVLDFDGVLTDNRVFVAQDGTETVACNRSDGFGLSLLRSQGLDVEVLSGEINPIVATRCNKLGLSYQQGLQDKATALQLLIAEKGIEPSQVVYLGNDVNDLSCMRLAGCGIAVADAHPTVLANADLILSKRGGHGAVRELCDLILSRK